MSEAYTVLLIDDEPDIREVAEVTLQVLTDWTVHTAGSGPEGIALAERLRPDLILLDVMMPGMDGPETHRLLRAHPDLAAIPVIFMTAKVQPVDRARFAEIGVAGVIAKPFDAMALPGQIRAVLGGMD